MTMQKYTLQPVLLCVFRRVNTKQFILTNKESIDINFTLALISNPS